MTTKRLLSSCAMTVLISMLLLQMPSHLLSAATPTPGGLGDSPVSPTPTSTLAEFSMITNTPSPQPTRTLSSPRQVLSFGAEGNSPGTLDDPRYIAFDTSGNIYVGNFSDAWISKFDAKGNYIQRWQPPSQNDLPLTDLTNDSQGNIYAVRDGFIYIYAPDGNLLKTLRNADVRFDKIVPLPNGGLLALTSDLDDTVLWLDSSGRVTRKIEKVVSSITQNTQLDLQLAVDSSGGVYLLSDTEHAIFHFSPQGKYLGRFGEEGDEPSQFSGILTGFAIDGAGNIFVGDFTGIKVFGPDTQYLSNVAVATNGIRVIRFDASGDMFLVTIEPKVVRYHFGGS